MTAVREEVREARKVMRAAVHRVELAELGLDHPDSDVTALHRAEAEMDAAARVLSLAAEALALEDAGSKGRLL